MTSNSAGKSGPIAGARRQRRAAAPMLLGAALGALPAQPHAKPPAPAPTSAPAEKPRTQQETYEESIPNTLVKFEMVRIPAGKITLPAASKDGNPQTVEVKSIWFGKTELTWDAFDTWAFQLDLTDKQKTTGVDAESRPSHPYGTPDRGFGHQGYPALAMTYHAAEEYCKWLSAKTGKKYRLPTETEWEYACCAGAAESPKGEALKKAAWFAENAAETTHPVAKTTPNAWGLYDMLGNVAEWCTAADGSHVIRGGSYVDDAPDVSAKARVPEKDEWDADDPQDPKSKWWLADGPFVGFRVVREE